MGNDATTRHPEPRVATVAPVYPHGESNPGSHLERVVS